MNIEDMTIKQVRELTALLGIAGTPKTSAYEIGANYLFRTVTHIVTGKLLEIHSDGLVVTDAAWIADTGRYAQAVAKGSFNEVEPYPDGARVVVNFAAMIDACQIKTTPRVQK